MMSKLYSALGALQHAVSPQNEAIGYWEKMGLQALGASSYRVATQAQDSELIAQVQKIYDLEKMPNRPKLVLYEQDVPNAAFVHTGTIVISTGLLKRLDKDEREVILAHEISHQKHGKTDMAVTLGYYAVTAGLAAVATHQVMKHLWKPLQNPFVNAVTFGAAAWLFSKATSIPLHAHQRHEELKADREAAWITRKPEKLASALQKLGNYPDNLTPDPIEIPQTDGNLPLPAAHTKAQGLYSTHPSVEERQAQMQRIEAEQKSRNIHHTQLNQGEGHRAQIINLRDAEEKLKSENHRA
ncbi:MAG: M48 family metalloprotease [Rickettsiales bacterium]|nr:M48 family metalloprotease [Rickettsiales bacterium]